MPKRHATSNTLSLGGSEWLAAERRLGDLVGNGSLIALIGGRGTGKTQLAVRAIGWAASEAIERARATPSNHIRCDSDIAEHTARYITAMGLFLSLKQTFADDAKESERTVIDQWCRPSLLVIDECQERGESAWENRILTHIIDRRYGDMKDTILIANLSPAEFSASMGESVIDRIRETGTLIECNWQSFRVKP